MPARRWQFAETKCRSRKAQRYPPGGPDLRGRGDVGAARILESMHLQPEVSRHLKGADNRRA
jgi:hypothetical protein